MVATIYKPHDSDPPHEFCPDVFCCKCNCDECCQYRAYCFRYWYQDRDPNDCPVHVRKTFSWQCAKCDAWIFNSDSEVRPCRICGMPLTELVIAPLESKSAAAITQRDSAPTGPENLSLF
jgi:hypothetical protein